jgi:hypothetical protein
MNSFYMIVLSIATVVLILLLLVVGLLLNRGITKKAFPPVANQCPDNWTIDVSGNCVVPTTTTGNVGVNSFNVSSTKAPYLFLSSVDNTTKAFDPTNTLWSSSGVSSICAKKTWANSNNIAWDGVDNYNSC